MPQVESRWASTRPLAIKLGTSNWISATVGTEVSVASSWEPSRTLNFTFCSEHHFLITSSPAALFSLSGSQAAVHRRGTTPLSIFIQNFTKNERAYINRRYSTIFPFLRHYAGHNTKDKTPLSLEYVPILHLQLRHCRNFTSDQHLTTQKHFPGLLW